jgi:hypothetical protein
MKVLFMTIQRFFEGLFALLKTEGIQIGTIICFIMYFLIAGFIQDCQDSHVTKREAAEWQSQKDQIWFDKERLCGETCGTTYSYRDGTCFCIGGKAKIFEQTVEEDYSIP